MEPSKSPYKIHENSFLGHFKCPNFSSSPNDGGWHFNKTTLKLDLWRKTVVLQSAWKFPGQSRLYYHFSGRVFNQLILFSQYFSCQHQEIFSDILWTLILEDLSHGRKSFLLSNTILRYLTWVCSFFLFSPTRKIYQRSPRLW